VRGYSASQSGWRMGRDHQEAGKVYSPLRFEKLVDEFRGQEEQLLQWKAGEYSTSDDRLQNFRQIAEFLDLQMSEIALFYLMRHIQSISVAVQEGKYAWDWNTEGGEGLKQRIADARNYLLLLAACLDEESENKC